MALPLFLMGDAPFRWSGTAQTLAWVAAGCGLALGWYALAGYVPRARAAYLEARAGRKTGAVAAQSQRSQR